MCRNRHEKPMIFFRGSLLHTYCDDCLAKFFKCNTQEETAKPTTSSNTFNTQVSQSKSGYLFPLFQQLPKELRLQIWGFTQQDESFSRVIEIVPKVLRLMPTSCYQYKVKVGSPPTLLQINREFRYELMAQYVSPFLLENTYTPLRRAVTDLVINPKTDTLFLTGNWRPGNSRGADIFTRIFGENSALLTKQLRTLALDNQLFLGDTIEKRMFWVGFLTPSLDQTELRQLPPNLTHLITTNTDRKLTKYEGGRVISFPMPTSPRNSQYAHPLDISKFGILDVKLEIGLQNMLWGDIQFGSSAGLWPTEDVPSHFLDALKKQEADLWKENEKYRHDEPVFHRARRHQKRYGKRQQAYQLKLKATRNLEGKQQKFLRDRYWEAEGKRCNWG